MERADWAKYNVESFDHMAVLILASNVAWNFGIEEVNVEALELSQLLPFLDMLQMRKIRETPREQLKHWIQFHSYHTYEWKSD